MPQRRRPLRSGQIRSPRGVSLIEILVSIGVISVGLLGSLALIIAGQHQAGQGVIYDRIGEVGRNVHRDFKVREMHNPANWAKSGGGSYGSINQGKWEWSGGPPKVVVIDPWGVAEGLGNFGSIPRISLRSVRFSGGNTNSGVMSLAQAKHVFQLRDDLIFDKPEGNGTLMQQQFLGNNREQRAADKSFSWAAMLVHTPKAGKDMYRLSVMVYLRRIVGEEGGSERPVNVSVDGGGYTGGEVTISGGGVAGVAVNPGEWMLLSSANPPLYQWYKIVAASEPEGGSRKLTLLGPDWLGPANTQGVIYSKDKATQNTNGTLSNNPFGGIVGVYEKTIRLTTSSLWSH